MLSDLYLTSFVVISKLEIFLSAIFNSFSKGTKRECSDKNPNDPNEKHEASAWRV